MPVQVRVLGAVGVTASDGSAVGIGGPRAAAVLAALALAGRDGARTDWLIGAVWGGREPASAARTVQTYLARLRSAAPGLIENRAQGYALGAGVVVDGWQAQEWFDAARAAQFDDPAQAERWLQDAAALWRGAVAEGAALDGATDAIRGLDELRRNVLAELVQVAERLGHGDVLLDAARLLLRLDPFREEEAAALARQLARLGRQVEALAVLRETRRALVEELGIEPSAPLREAEIAVLRQEIGSTGPAAAGDRLPTSLSSFVGREDDLRAVAEALSVSRLVSVVATGGAGKSRLALEVAHRWRDLGRSVLHVGLAGVAAGGIVEALRRAAGAGPSVGLADAVATVLPGQAPLLVLDNAEELLDEVAEIVERLASHQPQLHLLVTSRSALTLPGERVHLLGPLSMTGTDGGDAARLFVQRAEQVRPGVTTARWEDAIAISRELDGLPLALELAAARLRDISLGQLRTELADQLDRARLRGGSPRQRSLQAAMDGSLEALEAMPRQAHLRLAVLRDWWTDELAVDLLEDVVPDEAVSGVLDCLIAASLLVADVEGPARRMRAYEPVRQDALRRLRQSGDEPVALAAHLRAQLRLARRAEPRLRGPDEAAWLDTVDRSRDDMRAALEYARAHDGQALVELVTCCSRMWRMRWSPSFAMPWLRTALAIAGEPCPRAVIAADLAYLLTRLGEYEEAEGLADEAVTNARLCGDLALLGQTHHIRGLVDKDRLRYAEARPWLVQAAAYRHATGDVAGEALARGSIADMDAARGQFDQAETAYAEGLRLMRVAGSPSGQLAYLHSMAELQVGKGDIIAAARFLAEASPLAGIGDPVHAGLLQLVAAWIDRARSQSWEVCAASAREALRLTTASRDVRSMLDAVEHAAGVLLDFGRFRDARRLLAGAGNLRQVLEARRSATRAPIVERDWQRVEADSAAQDEDAPTGGLPVDLPGLVEAAVACLAGTPTCSKPAAGVL